MRTWLMLTTAAATASLFFAAACTVGSDCDFGLCSGPTTNADGSSGTEGGVPVPPGCDPNVDAKDAPLCVANDFAVFVDGASGKDENPGTREAPFKSVTQALTKRGAKNRVYVCEGSYKPFTLNAAVSVFGGFRCGSWEYSGTAAKFEAEKAGEYALRIQDVSAAVVVADAEFTAKPGDKTALSSIAAFVTESPSVTLRRVTLKAGAAESGADGVEGVEGTPTPADLNGNAGKALTEGGAGGEAKTCTCSSGGQSTGGRGGDTNGQKVDGENGTPAMAMSSPPTATGAGQTSLDCQATTNPARPGSDAPNVSPAPSPSSGGDVTAQGWKSVDGSDGEAGKPGQGGGGAGGKPNGANPGGGGAGACGGCGGSGGGGGKAGGSSIALLLLNSPVRLERCSLSGANAGNGGVGKKGGSGSVGGSGGTRVGSCTGADGGRGGDGGAGAGGSGGYSAAVLHRGAAPTPDSETQRAMQFGTGGNAGAGGAPGTNDGKPGKAGTVISL